MAEAGAAAAPCWCPVVLCPGLLRAGPADRSWHPDTSGALTPGGTFHSPSMPCTFFLNYFYYYHYFSPCGDGVSAEGEEGSKAEWSCSSSLQGWLQLHGREGTFPRSAPSLGHLAENLPVHPSGRRESFPSHMLQVPGWTCPARARPIAVSLPSAELAPCIPHRHEAELCHMPSATDALGEGWRRAG